jgi:hypothetical protein
MMTDLSYPIGKFTWTGPNTDVDRRTYTTKSPPSLPLCAKQSQDSTTSNSAHLTAPEDGQCARSSIMSPTAT